MPRKKNRNAILIKQHTLADILIAHRESILQGLLETQQQQAKQLINAIAIAPLSIETEELLNEFYQNPDDRFLVLTMPNDKHVHIYNVCETISEAGQVVLNAVNQILIIDQMIALIKIVKMQSDALNEVMKKTVSDFNAFYEKTLENLEQLKDANIKCRCTLYHNFLVQYEDNVSQIDANYTLTTSVVTLHIKTIQTLTDRIQAELAINSLNQTLLNLEQQHTKAKQTIKDIEDCYSKINMDVNKQHNVLIPQNHIARCAFTLDEIENYKGYAQYVIHHINNDILADDITFRNSRIIAIKNLAEQLLLSLLLEKESSQQSIAIYKLIELCRGNIPKKRVLNQAHLTHDEIAYLKQAPVLKKLYIELPDSIKEDINRECQLGLAETIPYVNSTLLIDNDDIAETLASNKTGANNKWVLIMRRASLFYNYCAVQERSFNPVQKALFEKLTLLITPHIKGDVPESVDKLLEKSSPLYKLFELSRGIAPHNRTLFKLPLTQEEYQHIEQYILRSSLPNLIEAHNPELIALMQAERYHGQFVATIYHDTEDSVIRKTSKLEHRPENKVNLISHGQSEFFRGFKFAVKGKLLQIPLKFSDVNTTLNSILMKELSVTADIANSIMAFISEQSVYYPFIHFLMTRSSQAFSEEAAHVADSQLPIIVNITYEQSSVYFDVHYEPIYFKKLQDIDFVVFPQANIAGESVRNFFDISISLKFKLMQGIDITTDYLQLIQINTNSPAAWQLLDCQSDSWQTIDTVHREIMMIEKYISLLTRMPTLTSDSAEHEECVRNRIAAKKAIENLLSNTLTHWQDYQLMQQYLCSIKQIPMLCHVIGNAWLTEQICFCEEKISSLQPQHKQVKSRQEQNKLLVPFRSQSLDTVGVKTTNVDFHTVQQLICNLCQHSGEELTKTKQLVETALMDGLFKTEADYSALQVALATLANDKMIYFRIGKDWLILQEKACQAHLLSMQQDAIHNQQPLPVRCLTMPDLHLSNHPNRLLRHADITNLQDLFSEVKERIEKVYCHDEQTKQAQLQQLEDEYQPLKPEHAVPLRQWNEDLKKWGANAEEALDNFNFT